ncbi:alpha-L-rhamnosidase [Marinoscillum sp. MHG1-6]|uniref:alpha-L-rhamnosidase n=1 Tax=Marinoscillum sp. MHG1-6 TaxID=2959627 RepID=UPI0021582104|nr:alpha-L-rhamnosidase [Marinoscillum sp. MHG1-6]
MRRIAPALIVFILLSCSGSKKEDNTINESISIGSMRTEGLVSPEGIDVTDPGLSWLIETNENDVYQTAYQVLVASSADSLTEASADLWNSGKVKSGATQIEYSGTAPDSNSKQYWKVKVWTNKGVTEWSQIGYWSTGLKYYKDWWGRWIGFNEPFEWEKIDTRPTLGARYLRSEFELEKKVKSATAYIIGLGLYEMFLNGQKVGEAVLAPAPTDYFENVKYNAYDVTNYLRSGESNTLGVVLGSGRYFTMRQNYKPYKIRNFGMPKLLFHMVITFEDGSQQRVWSHDKWKGTTDGPIRNNNEYDGEFYDARKELGDWAVSGYDDSRWLDVEYVPEPNGAYQAQMNPNMRVMKEIKPISISQVDQNRYVLDLGQNISGWLQMRVKGPKGTQVKLRFAESLQDDGELFVTNLRDAEATDTYILSGQDIETWEPSFTYHGFRYVEITGYPGKPTIDDFVGKFIYDEMETVGSFETSDPTINQIYANAWWGTASNYKGMPVDCPQRNERQPWLADHAVGTYGENFMFDNAPLYKKWLEDMRYAQKEDGSMSDVAPAYWNYYSDNMTWPGTMLIIARMLYEQTGDIEPIADNYSAMRKWLFYMRDRYMSDEYIMTKDSYGDWCKPPKSIEEGTGKNADLKEPSQLIASAYYYHFMEMMIEFASLTRNERHISNYQTDMERTKQAFNAKFYNEEGYYGEGRMTDNILPLYFGLVDDRNQEIVFDNLIKTIEEKNNGHLSTGLIGTQWLMRTLTKYGRSDLAYKLTTTRTYPSWGYMVENGATTIWELWHGNVANPKMNSQNHVMLLGDLIMWYYHSLAGIKAVEPGFKVIEMKPEFDVDLDYVKASYKSVNGLIKSHWTKKGEELTWNITVPPNTTALIYLPGKKQTDVEENQGKSTFQYLRTEGDRLVYELKSGNYEFRMNH